MNRVDLSDRVELSGVMFGCLAQRAESLKQVDAYVRPCILLTYTDGEQLLVRNCFRGFGHVGTDELNRITTKYSIIFAEK